MKTNYGKIVVDGKEYIPPVRDKVDLLYNTLADERKRQKELDQKYAWLDGIVFLSIFGLLVFGLIGIIQEIF